MVLKYLLTVAAVCCFFISCENQLPPIFDPKVHYNTIENVCGEGYYVQEHKVETSDGYILTIFRIPNAKKHPKIPPRRTQYQNIHEGYHPDFKKCFRDSRQQEATGPPILLSHGLLSSSDGWIIQGSNYDLAFMLVEKGYDVWFSNIRGNFYSRKHKTLKPSQPEFWDFSFHENGIYDMPDIIDYILEVTNYQKLTYVGHSMGTTMFFVMASMRPEYNDKVQLFVGMAPVSQIRITSYRPSRRVVLLAVMALLKACDKIGIQEFLPRTNLSDLLFKTICSRESLIQNFCYDSVFAIFGYHSKQFRRKSLPYYLSHAVNGVSTKTFLHYDQQLRAPAFQLYDYGPEKNLKKYGQTEPPKYDLGKIKAPVVLVYSVDDYISEIDDIDLLKTALPNVVEEHRLHKYNHVDFIWAYTARDKFYPQIIEAIDRFANRSKGLTAKEL